MKNFDEVLKKHEQNVKKHKRNNNWNYYYYFGYENDGATVVVCKYITTDCEECSGTNDMVKSFASPEKLDQFLTLLFEE
jgi:hypothetical protein